MGYPRVTFAAEERFSPIMKVIMIARAYPDVNTSSGSEGPANEPFHRQGQDVNTTDQVCSVVLFSLGIVSAVAADLLLWLII